MISTHQTTMAEITELDKKREAERRLALLALTGAPPEPSGSCLNPEELAALVEGSLAPEEADACLVHLASCDHCSALWMQLDREWQDLSAKSRPGTLHRLIGRPRFLATAGSLLAAAASIAVFFTLTTQVDRSTLPRLPEKSAQEQALPAPAPKPSIETLADKETDLPASPAATRQDRLGVTGSQATMPTSEPAESRKNKELVRSDRIEPGGQDAARPVPPPVIAAKRGKGEEKTVPVPAESTGSTSVAMRTDQKEQEAADLQRETTSASASPQPTMRAAAPLPAPVDQATPLTLDNWRSRIRQGCQGQPGDGFFTEISRQGNQLLRESAALNKQDRRQIERILAVLGKDQPTGQQCPALLDILGPIAQGQEQ